MSKRILLCCFVLMALVAVGAVADPLGYDSASRVCKKVQNTCSAPACTQGAPLAGDAGCLCNNSCRCTGQIECYVGAVVVETQQCTGTCAWTMPQPDDPYGVDTVAFDDPSATAPRATVAICASDETEASGEVAAPVAGR